MIVPINPHAASEGSPFINLKSTSPYHTAAVISSALEVMTGFCRVYDSRIDSRNFAQSCREWISSATCDDRYKFCNLESNIPFPVDISDYKTLDLLWATYESNRQVPTFHSMNPFMRSLSASVHGTWSMDKTLLNKNRNSAPFSNVVTIRGTDNPGVVCTISPVLASYSSSYS